MIDGALLALLVAVALHDELAGDAAIEAIGAPVALSWWLGVLAILGVIAWAWSAYCGRCLDRTGRYRWAWRAGAGLVLVRLATIGVHIDALFRLRVLEMLRRWMGDLVLVDEVLMVAPAVLVLLISRVVWFDIDQRMREAMFLRQLDDGEPVAAPPTRAGFLLDQLRHRFLVLLVPIGVLAGWSELVSAIGAAQRWSAGLIVGVQYAGILPALVLMPVLLRLIWSTRRLGDGALRSRLDELCREQEVRCKDILVWRTQGGVVNGALVGVIPQLRYVLLTDGLLGRLASPHIDAVMAHELAHARCHHLPWLLASLLAALTLAWGLAYGVVAIVAPGVTEASVSLTAAPAALALTVIWFGIVSRRFEWQADARAVQHLAGWHASAQRAGHAPPVIDAFAVEAMAGALGAVARHNNVRRHRTDFRHGSIVDRQARIHGLLGLRADALPIDGTVRLIKGITVLGLTATAIWVAIASGGS